MNPFPIAHRVAAALVVCATLAHGRAEVASRAPAQAATSNAIYLPIAAASWTSAEYQGSAWRQVGRYTEGHSRNLDAYAGVKPCNFMTNDIVGLSQASNGRFYAWYDDGRFSIGTIDDRDKYAALAPYKLPINRHPYDIVGIGIAGSEDHVYTWYLDGTVSEGTSGDLDAYSAPQPYKLPAGKAPRDIRAIDIAGSDDHVYVWYASGEVSSGWSTDLAAYFEPEAFQAKVLEYKHPAEVAEVVIRKSDDHVLTFWAGNGIGTGWNGIEWLIDGYVDSYLSQTGIPGVTVAVSRNGRIIHSKGYGYANKADGRNMTYFHRAKIGSVSKIITALGVMHRVEKTNGQLAPTSRLYGANGILKDAKYVNAYTTGFLRHKPIAAMAIAPDDRVVTWYDDGTYSGGSSKNLDLYQSPLPYRLLPGKRAADIQSATINNAGRVTAYYRNRDVSFGTPDDLARFNRAGAPIGRSVTDAIGFALSAKSGHVYVWYDDATVSEGDATTWDRYGERAIFDMPPSTRASQIVGMAIAGSDDHVYTWYDDETVTSGTSRDLDAYSAKQEFTLPKGKTPLDIVSISIAESDDHVFTWYDDWTMSEGTTTDLDAYAAPITVTGGPDQTWSVADVLGIAIDREKSNSYPGYSGSGAESPTILWLRDGAVRWGRANHLTVYNRYAVADGKTAEAIVGMDVAKSSGRVYTWYYDNTFSVGDFIGVDLDNLAPAKAFTLPKGRSALEIRDIGIAGSDDHVYTWYTDGKASSGWSEDLDAYDEPYAYSLPSDLSPKPDWLAWYAKLELRHLLSHTSGFERSGSIEGAMAMFDMDEDEVTYGDVHRHMLYDGALQFEPGTKYDYSNHDLGLAGYLLSASSGVPYGSYIQGHILSPLHLIEIVPAGFETSDRDSMLYNKDGTPCPDCFGKLGQFPLGLAAGGWSASAHDMVRLMLATDGLPNRPDILEAATLAEMEARPFPPPVSDYALGWHRNDKGALSHHGDTGGGQAYIIKFPAGYKANTDEDLSRINVAVVSNMDGTDLDKNLASDIAKLVSKVNVDTTYDLYDMDY